MQLVESPRKSDYVSAKRSLARMEKGSIRYGLVRTPLPVHQEGVLFGEMFNGHSWNVVNRTAKSYLTQRLSVISNPRTSVCKVRAHCGPNSNGDQVR